MQQTMAQATQRFSILSEEFHADPYQFFTFLRETEPVFYEAGLDSYFVSRHADVHYILNHPELFTTQSLAGRAEPVMRGPVLAQMHGREHTAKRKIVVRGFTGEMLYQHQAPLIRQNAEELLLPFLDRGHIDLVNDFGKKFAVWVTLDVLGLPKDDYQKVAQWHSGVADFITSISQSPDARAYSLACSDALETYLTPAIEERKTSPGPDLISTLCAAEFNGTAMTTNNVLALILNVLLAATEPADKTLALLVYHLLSNPGQLAEVQADMALLPNAIAETLRFTPPVQLIPRQTAAPVRIAGRDIPAASTVFCLIGAANRDPEAFTDPDVFDIHRPDLGVARSFTAAARHLAFGSGMHACVGAAFARTEIEIVSEVVLSILHGISLPAGFRYAEAGLYTRGPVALPLDFSPPPSRPEF